jgi:hypothetical protein
MLADLERESQLRSSEVWTVLKSVLAPFVLLLCVAAPALAQASQTPAEADFQSAVTRYLELHNRLKTEVPPLVVTEDAAEISRRSDMLATALQRSRQDARPGDIFNAAITELIIVRLREQLAGVDADQFLVSLSDEPTATDRPSIHMRYPVASSMATTPTRFLDALPQLPDALEYRLVGRALILRDRDAAMIVDYIADVLPRR